VCVRVVSVCVVLCNSKKKVVIPNIEHVKCEYTKSKSKQNFQNEPCWMPPNEYQNLWTYSDFDLAHFGC
jgi:hypothetical protein